MNLYYAFGAGLGHLTRALRVISTLKISPVTILTHSPHVSLINNAHVLQPDNQIYNNSSRLGDWVNEVCDERAVECIYIDSFPLGVKGELRLPGPLKKVYLARLLNWSVYKPFLLEEQVVYACSYVLETLYAEHQQWLEQCSAQVQGLTLAPRRHQVNKSIHEMDSPFCLVIHSGPDDEIRQLLHFAREQLTYHRLDFPLWLACPRCPEVIPCGVKYVNYYPADALIEKARVVVSAAGFNIMNEMRQYDKPHWVIPFDRRYDDQFFRLARARDAKS